MAARSSRVRRAALGGILWGTLCLAGCAGHPGSDIPPAPWAQLEVNRGAGDETVVWIELSGTFEGHQGKTAIRGTLSAEQISGLRELFRDERLAIYRSDALPTDGSVDLAGTAERPIFRVVVREESDAIRAGSEKLSAYFAEGAQRAETAEMLREVKAIIAAATPVP
ncbi:hypothetical protein WME79_07975 [Sorangium sp. So ce726]|uniref:hypothetical protein n=1 Tax=Sorangium sp. So ce726 TaxID=3133319 RepID=UPI003F5E8F43